ncbi:MAG: RNA-guided endonuclease InsQ/TnpB family protein [Chroococcales cyanobacterium]
MEDLNVSGMLKNHCLAGSIADASFYEFRRQLGYKTERYGSKLVIADRFYPSSQLCSNCNHRQKMPVVRRTFECQNCGLAIDRDLNASITLEKSLSFRRLHLWTGCCRQSRTKQEININIRLCPGLFKFYRAVEIGLGTQGPCWSQGRP